MTEAKEKSIMVNLEPTFYEVLARLANRQQTSVSGLVRRLIIKDLIDRGLITQQTLQEVVMG